MVAAAAAAAAGLRRRVLLLALHGGAGAFGGDLAPTVPTAMCKFLFVLGSFENCWTRFVVFGFALNSFGFICDRFGFVSVILKQFLLVLDVLDAGK